MNPAAENILGISQQRAHGQALLQLVDDEPEMGDLVEVQTPDGRTLTAAEWEAGDS